LGGLYVDACLPRVRVCSSCFALVVTRFRGPMSQSFALLADDWARLVLVWCVLGVRCKMASYVWLLGPVFLINWIMFSLISLIP
jgi:hypothetical protein